jgi:hypothetical protein
MNRALLGGIVSSMRISRRRGCAPVSLQANRVLFGSERSDGGGKSFPQTIGWSVLFSYVVSSLLLVCRVGIRGYAKVA